MKRTTRRSADESPQRDRVFVLRFWLERHANANTAAIWRGKVTDLRKGEEKHVSGVEHALAVVREAMSEAPENLNDERL